MDMQYFVVCIPYQAEPYVTSIEDDERSARRAAGAARAEFARRHPNGYGYQWLPCAWTSDYDEGDVLSMDRVLQICLD